MRAGRFAPIQTRVRGSSSTWEWRKIPFSRSTRRSSAGQDGKFLPWGFNFGARCPSHRAELILSLYSSSFHSIPHPFTTFLILLPYPLPVWGISYLFGIVLIFGHILLPFSLSFCCILYLFGILLILSPYSSSFCHILYLFLHCPHFWLYSSSFSHIPSFFGDISDLFGIVLIFFCHIPHLFTTFLIFAPYSLSFCHIPYP